MGGQDPIAGQVGLRTTTTEAHTPCSLCSTRETTEMRRSHARESPRAATKAQCSKNKNKTKTRSYGSFLSISIAIIISGNITLISPPAYTFAS